MPEDERPWGDINMKGAIIEAHANRVMDDIIANHKNTFDFLRDGLNTLLGQEIEKIYIPGNHDRLCHVYETSREKVSSILGIPGSNSFPHAYDDMQYGNKYRVFARYGHEFDK